MSVKTDDTLGWTSLLAWPATSETPKIIITARVAVTRAFRATEKMIDLAHAKYFMARTLVASFSGFKITAGNRWVITHYRLLLQASTGLPRQALC
jgi:hypothetical protein